MISDMREWKSLFRKRIRSNRAEGGLLLIILQGMSSCFQANLELLFLANRHHVDVHTYFYNFEEIEDQGVVNIDRETVYLILQGVV